ncbi:MAG: hypothetical protein COA44_09835 [Arcobacter sp.]|nr:MAG: hypothetical protein COA44_09835 [Arcobacter sp.]
MYFLEDLNSVVNALALILGLAYGLIAQKTQFCFSGSIKDIILTKSTRRLASVIVATIVAISFSQILSSVYNIDFSKTVYLQSQVNYITIIIGGVMFGIGMMKADGCSSRHLIKFVQGDWHSLVTLLCIAVFAYLAAKGLFSYPLTELVNNELLIRVSSYIPNNALSIFIIVPLLIFALYKVVPTLKDLLSCVDGLLIGLLIGFAWVVTGVIGIDSFDPRTLEAFSFVYPLGKSLEYLMFFSGSTLSFGVSLIFGIFLGGFIMSRFNKKHRFSCAIMKDDNKLKNNIFGGALMGVGGILSLGCTIGQGLTGVSTLALASFVAIISISVSAYITALVMSKEDKLYTCFIFEWESSKS